MQKVRKKAYEYAVAEWYKQDGEEAKETIESYREWLKDPDSQPEIEKWFRENRSFFEFEDENAMNKRKKPFYQQIWFFALIGIVVALFILTDGDTKEDIDSPDAVINSTAKGGKSNEGKKTEELDLENKVNDSIVLTPSNQNENLKDYITSLDSPLIEYEDQDIKIIGIEFGKKGIPSILGIKEVSGEYIGSFSVLQGLNSDGKRDAELILFLELKPKKKIEPRSGIAATLPKIVVADNKGDNAQEVASVPNDATETYYRDGENIIAAVGFAVYSDAETFVINVGGQKFLVEELNYRTEEEF